MPYCSGHDTIIPDILFSSNATKLPSKKSRLNENITGFALNLRNNSKTWIQKVLQNTGVNTFSTKDEDMFYKHFHYDIAAELKEQLLNKTIDMEQSTFTWPTLGKLRLSLPNLYKESLLQNHKRKDLNTPHTAGLNTNNKLKKLTETNIFEVSFPNTSEEKIFQNNDNEHVGTRLQSELFCVMNNYHDVFYPQQTIENSDDIRAVYCFHVVDHVLNTQRNINNNNKKIKSASKQKNPSEILNVGSDIEYRDRGLVRPKVLILLPFRQYAVEVINAMVNILYPDNSELCKANGSVTNYHRFLKEFSGIVHPKRSCFYSKAFNHTKLFFGNLCDNFKLGVSISNNIMKIYSDFYSSDIIIASPLGIRRVIGAYGDDERDFDFLSSIEIFILDQADIFIAQNWENVLHIVDHMNLKPTIHRRSDLSRVYSSCLNELSQFYRQTVLFSSYELTELRSFFESKCSNYSGKIHISNPILIGSIKNIILNTPQTFYKIDVSCFMSTFESRFIFFIKKILPKIKKLCVSHCLIYIPSYFDFVRLRNYFKQEQISFVHICEYAKTSSISRARDIFYHSRSPFLLYSERSHFFQRWQIKGIRHLIFYQPPSWPNLYAEMINLMHESNQNVNDGLGSFKSVTVLYTKYDLLQMKGILGNENAERLVKSVNLTNIFSCN